MKNCNLDENGNITFNDFCAKMEVNITDWVNPMFLIDRGSYISFIYDEWESSVSKQKIELQNIISGITQNGRINIKQFYDILNKIEATNFSAQASKFFTNDDDEHIEYLAEQSVIDIILKNSIGGYTSEFFRDYVKGLFPFLDYVYRQV
jgi:hypothetical protein